MNTVISNGDIVEVNGKKYKGRNVVVKNKEIWIDGVLMKDGDELPKSFFEKFGAFVFWGAILIFSALIIFG